jgi:hypothetical protein
VLGLVLGDPRADVVGALVHLPSVALWTAVAGSVVLAPLRRRPVDRSVPVASLPVLAPLGRR